MRIQADQAQGGRRVRARDGLGVDAFLHQRAHQPLAGEAGRDRGEQRGRLAQACQADGQVEGRAAHVRVQRHPGARFLALEHVQQGLSTDHQHRSCSGISIGRVTASRSAAPE